MVGVLRWESAAVGLALVISCACSARSLVPGADAGADAASVTTPTAGAGQAAAGGYGGRASAGEGGAGGAESALCPPVDQVGPAGSLPTLPPPAPTSLPVSCQGMPPVFMFPAPGADVPGLYTRCASFDVGAAKSVAVSPDGRLAALVTNDGLARMISIASQQVLAVLASPRAMIYAVAYEPHGRGVLTLAHAQREVTLWRASDWTPVWRVTLPGTAYYHAYVGGVAFSPDGATAVVSPGSDTFLLDVASGAIRARRTNAWDAVLDVAYGWGGRRIVVAEPSLAAHCNHGPNGGTISVLDAGTLATIATVADLGDYNRPGGFRGIPAFRASPVDDLVLVSPSVGEPPSPHAFRLSDGAALPAPAVTALPTAFTPDGASVLSVADGVLQRIRLADGAMLSSTTLGSVGPIGMSADGGVLAVGSGGGQLLRVLTAGADTPATVCTTDDPAGYAPPSALSFDGQVLALARDGEVRIIRRADGAVVGRIADGTPPESMRLMMSPRAQYVVTIPWNPPGDTRIFQVSDGAQVGVFAKDDSNWPSFAFSDREDRVYRTSRYLDGGARMDALNLASGASSATSVPLDTAVIGTSKGCPVLYQGGRGAWRSCGGCDDGPVAGAARDYFPSPPGAALSPDGTFVATWSDKDDPGVKLWWMPPGIGKITDLTPRPGWKDWTALEFPVAIASGGARILTSATPSGSCYYGPEFSTEVHDLAMGRVVDTLPPAPTATDGALRTVAFGAQLWCAR